MLGLQILHLRAHLPCYCGQFDNRSAWQVKRSIVDCGGGGVIAHAAAGAMRGVDVDEINDHLSSGESVYLPGEQLEYYLEEMDRREKTSELQDA